MCDRVLSPSPRRPAPLAHCCCIPCRQSAPHARASRRNAECRSRSAAGDERMRRRAAKQLLCWRTSSAETSASALARRRAASARHTRALGTALAQVEVGSADSAARCDRQKQRQWPSRHKIRPARPRRPAPKRTAPGAQSLCRGAAPAALALRRSDPRLPGWRRRRRCRVPLHPAASGAHAPRRARPRWLCRTALGRLTRHPHLQPCSHRRRRCRRWPTARHARRCG
jgi:hypothetical protein